MILEKTCVLREKKTEKYSLIILKNTVDDNKELLFVSFLFRAFSGAFPGC